MKFRQRLQSGAKILGMSVQGTGGAFRFACSPHDHMGCLRTDMWGQLDKLAVRCKRECDGISLIRLGYTPTNTHHLKGCLQTVV